MYEYAWRLQNHSQATILRTYSFLVSPYWGQVAGRFQHRPREHLWHRRRPERSLEGLFLTVLMMPVATDGHIQRRVHPISADSRRLRAALLAGPVPWQGCILSSGGLKTGTSGDGDLCSGEHRADAQPWEGEGRRLSRGGRHGWE
jgi:hypothetical protein